MIELARSSVQTWECDQMGHMNVQFYVEKATDALAAFGATIGLGPRALAARGLTLAVTDQHIRFLRELRPGTPYFLRGGAVTAAEESMIFYCELVQTASGDVSATFANTVRLQNNEAAAERFSPEVRLAALERRIEVPTHGAARGLTLSPARAAAPTLAQADEAGLLTTFRGMVRTTDCDGQSRMLPRAFMARLSDSIPNLLVQTSGRNRGDGGATGGAALEYRFVYRGRPRDGDVLCIRSGLKSIGAKTYIWVHWMFDAESGACVASAEAVAVAMDLTTRKAIALPDELRARLEPLLVDGIGV